MTTPDSPTPQKKPIQIQIEQLLKGCEPLPGEVPVTQAEEPGLSSWVTVWTSGVEVEMADKRTKFFSYDYLVTLAETMTRIEQVFGDILPDSGEVPQEEDE